MEIITLIKGIAIGFSLAAPVGPVGIMCIRRTLTYGARGGLLIGISAALADVVYGLFAAFGVTLVANFIVEHQASIRLVGGALLVLLGIHSVRTPPKTKANQRWTDGHLPVAVSTFALALTNPMTMFAFVAAFSGFGIQSIIETNLGVTLLVGGVFLGSFLWFTTLIAISRIFKEKVTEQGFITINKVVGYVLVGLGILGMVVGAVGLSGCTMAEGLTHIPG